MPAEIAPAKSHRSRELRREGIELLTSAVCPHGVAKRTRPRSGARQESFDALELPLAPEENSHGPC